MELLQIILVLILYTVCNVSFFFLMGAFTSVKGFHKFLKARQKNLMKKYKRKTKTAEILGTEQDALDIVFNKEASPEFVQEIINNDRVLKAIEASYPEQIKTKKLK